MPELGFKNRGEDLGMGGSEDMLHLKDETCTIRERDFNGLVSSNDCSGGRGKARSSQTGPLGGWCTFHCRVSRFPLDHPIDSLGSQVFGLRYQREKKRLDLHALQPRTVIQVWVFSRPYPLNGHQDHPADFDLCLIASVFHLKEPQLSWMQKRD
jgi:hypothetical protein